MARPGRRGKEKEEESCRLSVVGCQLAQSQGNVDSCLRRNDRVTIGVHPRSSAVAFPLRLSVSARKTSRNRCAACTLPA